MGGNVGWAGIGITGIGNMVWFLRFGDIMGLWIRLANTYH